MPGYSSQPPPVWPPQPPAPRKSRAVPILVTALIASVITAGALAFYLLRNDQTPSAATPAHSAEAVANKINPGEAFQVIYQNCQASNPTFDVEDGGHTLNIVVGGLNGMSTDTMTCVLNSLNVPDAVRQHISTTRALDGQQTDVWDDFTARWTYYPDDGLQMTIREP